jgi:uncharacterized protein (DUF2236 family)
MFVSDGINDREDHFEPGSPFWRVNREMLLGLAGMRALLMEIAHPLIAAGVAGHSDFYRRPLKRLYQTMRQMTRITFGNRKAVVRAVRHINRCHRSVHGTLAESSGKYRAGCPYDADDPHLKLWVLATLIDSSLCFYEVFVARLTLQEKESYYRDSRRMGRLLGVHPRIMPACYSDFSLYMKAVLEGDTLIVTHDTRRVAGALLGNTLFGRVAKLLSFASVGLLPEKLREAYGLPWEAQNQQRLLQIASFSRRWRRRLPDIVCVNPHASLAEVLWRARRLLSKLQRSGRQSSTASSHHLPAPREER